MTLGAFVDAAYALMVRTFAGIPGKTLLEAVDLANETFGITAEKQVSVEADNESSLRQLEAMMAGV